MRTVSMSAGWLGKMLPGILLGAWLGLPLSSVAQPQATFISPPVVPVPPSTTPPQVNATNFINAGVWNIFTAGLPPVPYQTFSTYNYTNSGSMTCFPGWEFDYGPYPTGPRGWSANFFNDTLGSIAAGDISVLASDNNGTHQSAFPSSLFISATNIVNKGLFSAGGYGLLILHGSAVNLSRSGLEITPIVGQGSTVGDTNFSPDVAIYDKFWRPGTNSQAFAGSPWTGSAILAQTFHGVGQPCGQTNQMKTIGPVYPSVADSFFTNSGPYMVVTTNEDLATSTSYQTYSNIYQQAVFASASDSSIIPSVRFGQQLSKSNLFLPMAAQFIAYSTNLVTGAPQANTIYVVDNLAAVGTNGYLQLNTYFDPGAICQAPSYRPDSVYVARNDNGTYTHGKNYYGVPPDTFFYDPLTYSNFVAFGQADAYSCLVDNLAAEPPAGFTVTNAPGRVEIYAKDLNLNRTRISASAGIVISASNLVSSAGAVMDCQNLSFNIGSTNGLLNVTNLAGQNVNRLQGTVSEWSGFWTNYIVTIYTNWIPDPASTNTPPDAIRSDITNAVQVNLAITVVDASGLSTVVPVNVLNLMLHSTNLVVSDILNVGDKLLFDGQTLTINGGLNFYKNLQSWASINAPTLRNFTNNGTLNIPNGANFGADTATNYAAFVNNGTLSAGSVTLNADVFQAGGSQSVSGSYLAMISSGKAENGSLTSGQDIQFYGGSLKLNNFILSADDHLYFQMTGALFDSGASSGNIFTCGNGFDLAVKPATGDLLGTKLTTTTPVFASVDHYWSADDRGAYPAGYTNNVAVGQLALVEGNFSQFIFHATGASNAVYADVLDLSACPDFLDPDVLTIDPNFVIYYAAVKLPGTFVVPPNSNGVPQEAEEYLNGQFGGHLQWVSGFAGPNSSVDVLINGQTVKVNKALRYSKIIDSNGNGIPNYYDANPFDPPAVVVSGSVVSTNPPPAGPFTITWTAAPYTVYQVQYSTSLGAPNWLPLQSYTNNTSTSVVVTIHDTNAVSGQRFYRVSHH